MAYGDLTTLADVKAWLQIGHGPFPPADDALLTRLITAASEYIQTWLNRRIPVADYFEVRDGTGGQHLRFACFPVNAVLSLTIDGIAIPPALPIAASAAPGAGYTFSPTQLFVRGYRFTRHFQNVGITYTAGYSVIPPEISQACIELVALRYRERTRVGEISKSFGGGETVSYSQGDMTASIRTLLRQYQAVVSVGSTPVMLAATATDVRNHRWRTMISTRLSGEGAMLDRLKRMRASIPRAVAHAVASLCYDQPRSNQQSLEDTSQRRSASPKKSGRLIFDRPAAASNRILTAAKTQLSARMYVLGVTENSRTQLYDGKAAFRGQAASEQSGKHDRRASPARHTSSSAPIEALGAKIRGQVKQAVVAALGR